MNKFLDKRVKASPRVVHEENKEPGIAIGFLNECAACWNALDEARRKLRRSLMYSYGDQWGDLVTDPDTLSQITEGELIKKNGKVPLKNNMIAPILSNIEGQLRQNLMRPVCVARDQSESRVGEMMSVAVEYVHDINEMEELDADSMRMLLNGGMTAQRIEYGLNSSKDKRDVWVYSVNPSRLFFNTNLEDVRMWDLTCVGELFDLSLDDVLAHFGNTPQQKERIRNIYSAVDSQHYGTRAMQGDEVRSLSFYTASRTNLCRVILGWKLESRDAYFWNDTMRGTWGYLPYDDASLRLLEIENTRRRDDMVKNGKSADDALLVEYEFATERYWYYRYMSPYGDVLQEGRSPYWHGEHNYVLHLYPLIQGRLGNFVEQFIDQQRAINRTATLIDFIRGTSSKGVLVVDDDAFESMSREEVIDEYVRYNGVLFVKLKPGQSIDGVVRQYNSGAAVAGDFELLNLQLRLINEISGVNSAMQGQSPRSGTPASLYAQQVQNSSLNLKGLFDGFRTFRRRRDSKVMKTLQQYYTESRYIDLAGSQYSDEAKWYDPKKVQDSELDITISEGFNTPAYQMLANDFLMELFRANALDVKTMLENSSYPFATRILEAIKRNEEAAAQGEQLQGIPPELMEQLQGGGAANSGADGLDVLQTRADEIVSPAADDGVNGAVVEKH
ncbi:MAG: hypothetical protein J6Q73_03860 [Bacteroidaceae bacterium]|nr:hypothetical protein [Bacteroidaceae bacterium]